jgi:hypothetical protein
MERHECKPRLVDLPPVQRFTLARILLDLTEEEQEFSPEIQAAWEEEICRRMEADLSLKAGGIGRPVSRRASRYALAAS